MNSMRVKIYILDQLYVAPNEKLCFGMYLCTQYLNELIEERFHKIFKLKNFYV